MAGQRSKRRSRKRRQTGTGPRAVPSPRREHRIQREVAARAERQSTPRTGKHGERPPGLFGGVPVSEISILAGLVAVVVGWVNGGTTTLLVGVLLCALGVFEVTSREHFSGFRSHSTLLAALPAVGTEVALAQILPASWPRGTGLIGAAIVFGLLFFPLRRRFARARQRRVAQVARPPRG